MDINEYLSLPYTRQLKRDDEGDWIATIPELEGCMADGPTELEALSRLNEVQASWLRAALKAGTPIPLPREDADLPSGKWVQRVPRSLHAKLVAAAEEEETSLNQLVITLLAEGLALRREWRQPLRVASGVFHFEVWHRLTPGKTFFRGDRPERFDEQAVERLKQPAREWGRDSHPQYATADKSN